MIGEIWTYQATKPSDGLVKARPVLIIGDDGNNQLNYVDIHYVIISSSAECGIYDVEIDEQLARELKLQGKSVIKTTKIYTGAKSKLGSKISNLPEVKQQEFIKKYENYQSGLISQFQISKEKV